MLSKPLSFPFSVQPLPVLVLFVSAVLVSASHPVYLPVTWLPPLKRLLWLFLRVFSSQHRVPLPVVLPHCPVLFDIALGASSEHLLSLSVISALPRSVLSQWLSSCLRLLWLLLLLACKTHRNFADSYITKLSR